MMQLVNLLDSESLDDVTGYTKTEHLTWTDEPYRIDFASRGEIEHASTWQGPNFDYYFNKFGFRNKKMIKKSKVPFRGNLI